MTTGVTRDQRGAGGGCRPRRPPVQPGSDGRHSEAADLRWRSGGSTMTEGPGAKDAPPPSTDEERARGQDLFGLGERDRQAVLAWVGENLTQVRRSVYEQRLLHWSLGIGVVVGLAANVGGYLLKSAVTTEPLGLVADLLYALGYALWTGVVVVLFVRSFRRQNGGSSSRCWMPTRQRSAMRPEPEASRGRETTERRQRGSGGSQPLELAGAGQRAGQVEERLEDVGAAFVFVRWRRIVGSGLSGPSIPILA